MKYSVVWQKAGAQTGTKSLGSLADAVIYAICYFDSEQRKNGVDRVEVRNESGALCFQHAARRRGQLSHR